MIDFFAIFSHGGLVLWCFQATSQGIESPINALIKYSLFQERPSNELLTHDMLALQYKLDNEFDLVYVVGYQKMIHLAYADRLLSDVQIEFRDRYKSDLTYWHSATSSSFLPQSKETSGTSSWRSFDPVFAKILFKVEEQDRVESMKPSTMRTFKDSAKSSKTVKSMLKDTDPMANIAEDSKKKRKSKGKGKQAQNRQQEQLDFLDDSGSESAMDSLAPANKGQSATTAGSTSAGSGGSGEELPAGGSSDDAEASPSSSYGSGQVALKQQQSMIMASNRLVEPESLPARINGHGTLDATPPLSLGPDDLQARLQKIGKIPKKTAKGGKSDSPVAIVKKQGKMDRTWGLPGSELKPGEQLDYCKPAGAGSGTNGQSLSGGQPEDPLSSLGGKEVVGKMVGQLRDLNVEATSDEGLEFEEEEAQTSDKGKANGQAKQPTASRFGGVMNMFRSLVGSKVLSLENMKPAIDKMKDHLISKNVAADIADKLCASVATRLEGRQIGTLATIGATVREAVQESCMRMLTPKRTIEILSEVQAARTANRPYVIVFCGVNGVGKSTNLAKICFWLIENKNRVLIAACDTFRAGAVEQLRTHVRRLCSLHPGVKSGQGEPQEWVQLYERGYAKDPSGIAADAIGFARSGKFDVVLVDTAGRMQDNAPLMQALSKLIDVNSPDLVLFVGEALVGNDAVDQLVKFNRALSDYSRAASLRGEQPHTIDGIVLTKFDTVDDKVGAAISMVYTTGQPIVFVGTGQTYTDLYRINARAVTNALLK